MDRTALINQVKSKIDELSPEDAVLVDVGFADEKPIDTIIDDLLDESAKEVLLKAPIYKLTATACNNSPVPDIPNDYIYNVTTEQPLESSYYTASAARMMVPLNIRRVGLVITYQTGASSWVLEQYIGVGVLGWDDVGNWSASISQPPTPIVNSYTGIVIVPDDFLRLVEFKMTEWRRSVSIINLPGDPVAKRQSNKWLRAGTGKPVVILSHRDSNRVLEYYSVVNSHTIERFLYIKSDIAENIPETLQDALCWICASKVLAIFNNAATKTALENAISLLT
jgi:hypothetical protein